MRIWTFMWCMLFFASMWEAFVARVLGVSNRHSAHYEGRTALPHPPAIVTWTHIKPQPPLKCCELQQHGHRNRNIKRHLAVKSREQFWGQALQRTVATSNKQWGAYGWSPLLPTLFLIFWMQSQFIPHSDLIHISSNIDHDVSESTCLLNTN